MKPDSKPKSNGGFRIPIPQLVIITVCMPFSAFLLCIYLSLANNFSLATATHCGVSKNSVF